jgi:lipid-binding SYLF domain-containing protein
MSLALGPLGRNGEASGALNTNGKMAAMCVQIPLSSPNCSEG